MNQGERIVFEYDEDLGNVEIHYDSNNNAIRYIYDDGSRTEYDYLEDSRVITEYDASGKKLEQITESGLDPYDFSDKIIKTVYFDSKEEEYKVSNYVYHDKRIINISETDYKEGYTYSEDYTYKDEGWDYTAKKITHHFRDGEIDPDNYEITESSSFSNSSETTVIRDNQVAQTIKEIDDYQKGVLKVDTISYVKTDDMHYRETGEWIITDGENVVSHDVVITYADSKKMSYNYTITQGVENGEFYYNRTCKDVIIENFDGSIDEYVKDNEGKVVKRVTTYKDGSKRIIYLDYDNESFIIGSHEEMLDSNGMLVEQPKSFFNHIEYDKEAYNTLMQNLLEISNVETLSDIGKNLDYIDDQLLSLPDKYSGELSYVVKSNVINYFDDIKGLQSNINYSLLSYQICDDELLDSCKNLIDNLFEENETNLAKVFKNNVNRAVEDKDSDGILEYKENIDYQRLYQNIIPAYKHIDEDGNIWYFNKNKNLISAEGEDLKVNFGGETFGVSFDDGIIKLTDSFGNPLNIFGEYNINSSQYGGNQADFIFYSYSLLENDEINAIFDLYDPSSTPEERAAYLNSVGNSGCGKVALTNLVFKSFEGKEKEFYDSFGYSMYNVKMNDDGSAGGIDYNYEPLILELSLTDYRSVSYAEDANLGASLGFPILMTMESGTIGIGRMKEYLEKYHGISNSDYPKDYVFFGDEGYNLFGLDGTSYVVNGGSHAMIKTEEINMDRCVVSSWGKKYICELNNPLYHYED